VYSKHGGFHAIFLETPVLIGTLRDLLVSLSPNAA